MPPDIQSAWEKVSGSVAFVQSGGAPVEVAVLIDDKGHFLAHKSGIAMTGPNMARTSDGSIITLTPVSIDPFSELELLQAQDWSSSAKPITVAPDAVYDTKGILAVMPNGPMSAQYVCETAGVSQPSMRFQPLSVVRFENTSQKIGGGLMFTADGTLLGVLTSSLAPLGGQTMAKIPLGGEQPGRPRTGSSTSGAQRGVSVSYGLGVDLVRRVVDGFLSPSHQVQHPSIGCFFRDANGNGAKVEEVMPGSPSEAGGLKVGDIIVKANSTEIHSPVDFAIVLFKQSVGGDLTLTVQRDGQTSELKIKVGAFNPATPKSVSLD